MIELTLTQDTYDGVVSALTGNGTLCTTVCPTGYHAPPEAVDDRSHLTQHFVMAGRRRFGPQHPLVNFGTISRTLKVGGRPPQPLEWKQLLDVDRGAIVSEWLHEGVRESTRSSILLHDNVFLADTAIQNTGDRDLTVTYTVAYRMGEDDAQLSIDSQENGRDLHFQIEDHMGLILLRSRLAAGVGELEFTSDSSGISATLTAHLAPEETVVLSSWLHFSDRMGYEFPVDGDEIDAAAERHEDGWKEFWSRSEVTTGDEVVDTFRKTSLYTLRCQATPWSIPPTLSSEYWGGGAFHDELYPFLGLLSSNYPELAERIPYFRLATLPPARQRAIGRGALYPWSSTEFGEERDPHGHWLTERFHLGQFAICIHMLWLYEQDRTQLDDLYPVLRALARYYELSMLEEGADGELGTLACTDFDESVGKVKNGIFTICAVVRTFECTAQAAETLGCDGDRACTWKQMAEVLRKALPMHMGNGIEEGALRYDIPEDKATHSAIMGPVFPFMIDVDSVCARSSAAFIHEVCRSTKGWKPGLSCTFDGHNWMWTAGHLGIVHALQRSPDLAWEAVRLGPASAGPFLSPNEHRNCDDTVVVPWFTTGCGAWIYALNAMFVQVDEEGAALLPAVPEALADVRFRDLRASEGVLVSGKFSAGRLEALSVRAPRAMTWRFRMPEMYLCGRSLRWAGTVDLGTVSVKVCHLKANEEVSVFE